MVFSLFLTFFVHYVLVAQQYDDSLNIFQTKQQEYLALTQYYRWFQTFEREQNERRIKNHLSLLSDSILMNTYNGPVKGKDGMKWFLDYVKPWKNSHHVEKVKVVQNSDAFLSLEADILYQNILPDSSRNNYKLHYSTTLKQIDNELPIFTFIELLPTSKMDSPTFEDAYVENRSKSFMYYWMFLVDNLKGNEGKFKELLAPDFSLDLPFVERVKSGEQFEVWRKMMQSKISSSLHSPKNFKANTNTDGTFHVSFDVEWRTIGVNGDKTSIEAHYDWILENNLDERFARIKEMKVKQIKPVDVVDKF